MLTNNRAQSFHVSKLQDLDQVYESEEKKRERENNISSIMN